MNSPLSDQELAAIVGGFEMLDRVRHVAHDAYRGAVNWGVGALVGTQTSRELYKGQASWGAWWGHVKATHDALDQSGAKVELLPLIKSAFSS